MSKVKKVTSRDSTETATTPHRFNRYEIKYLMEESCLSELSDLLRQRMDSDPHQEGEGPSRVSSLYYDSHDLRCYREKIEGLHVRRKLRIRAYGDPETINDESIVFVEIKQRVNRGTQKRRIPMSYADARILCDERLYPQSDEPRQEFVDEILNFIEGSNLQPTVITSYQREAFIGVDADSGLRITLDHQVCGRNRDFDLGATTDNQFIIPPQLAIVEVKASEGAPPWFGDMAAKVNLIAVRISKYCKSIEAHHMGGAHRTGFP